MVLPPPPLETETGLETVRMPALPPLPLVAQVATARRVMETVATGETPLRNSMRARLTRTAPVTTLLFNLKGKKQWSHQTFK